MLDTQGLPPYPPARNAWEFPPPPVPKRWKWVAILATTVAVVVAVILVVVLVDLSDEDAPGIIEDQELVSIIERECDLMTSTVESMPVTGPVPQQGRAILDQNRAVDRMLSAIERDAGGRIGRDRPAQEWLDDWRAIVEARESYVADLGRDGSAELEVPLDSDGEPVSRRMEDVWLTGSVCDVPPALLAPDDDQSSSDI